jgi:hypothetical protein
VAKKKPRAPRARQIPIKGIGESRQLVSGRRFAELMGVSEAAVRRAIKDGRLTPVAPGRIDPVAGRRQWFASTDPSKPLNAVTGNPSHHRDPGAPETPMGLDFPMGTNGVDAETRGALRQFALARATREAIKARIEQKELQRLEGKLIDVDKVRATAFAQFRRARDLLLTLPDRVSKTIAGVSDEAEVFSIVQEECRHICAELARPIVPTPDREDAAS